MPQATPTPPVLKKAGVIIAADSSRRNAHAGIALAGEVIEYTLTTTNGGSVAYKDQLVKDNLYDTLEYADIINPGKGSLADGIMTWPKADIKPGESYTVSYQVRIKSPIPSRPTSISDPLSYDLRMDDVYGNLVSTTLAVPSVAKQVEVASAQLPQTGSGTTTTVVLTIVSLIAFFYFRNRQLVTEVSLLRSDHHGHGEHR
jgi:LPXTG-motif cell wall-anchored protein